MALLKIEPSVVNSTGDFTFANVAATKLTTTNGLFWANGTAFTSGGGGGGTSTSSSTPPGTPTVGDTWYDTTTDTIYRYTSDGTTSAWLDITGSAVSVSATATTYKTMIYSMVFGAQ